jgi:hypothetical protein
MWNAICNNKKRLKSLCFLHIKNTRTSIPTGKTEGINCKTLSRAWTVLKTISFHYISITFTGRNQAGNFNAKNNAQAFSALYATQQNTHIKMITTHKPDTLIIHF